MKNRLATTPVTVASDDPAQLPQQPAHRRRRRRLARPTPGLRRRRECRPGLIAVAQFMVILDATIVNVALPTIKVDVGFSEQSLSWVLNAYTLMFAASSCSAGASPTGSGGGGFSWPGSRSSPAPR